SAFAYLCFLYCYRHLRHLLSFPTRRSSDLSPILFGQLFGPLRDLDFFNQVSLDPDFHTLVWPNGADFDPSDLRHWPEALPFFLKDRKSTRLNSSHLGISYAVFCLKKKKTKQ